MSTGAVKGIEVLLIAGVIFWFAYSQLNALKQSKPTDKDNTASATEGQDNESERVGSSATRSQGDD